jgi:DNA repair exonuclease SbcCD ATPase subunit
MPKKNSTKERQKRQVAEQKKQEADKKKEEADKVKQQQKEEREKAKEEKKLQKQLEIEERKHYKDDIQRKKNDGIQKKKDEELKVINEQRKRDEGIINILKDDIHFDDNFKPIFKILQSDGSIIKNIIHIADIHIKRNIFHERYDLVFNRFYDDLKTYKINNPDTIVCLCGDLFDEKDDLKTYSFDHTVNFIKNVSNIFPLVLISGNHDTIEYNKDQIDPIGTILKHLTVPNVYHLKVSGVYQYNNIIFGVSSIFDKYILSHDELMEIYSASKLVNTYNQSDIKKIGLYHGQIMFDGMWFNSSNVKTLEQFGAYDYILLGDIHRFTYLNKEKTVAYCSSMISQTTAETDDYHGYLEWNILNGKSSYHSIKNEFSHHEIDLTCIIEPSCLDEILKSTEIVKPQVKISDELIIKELEKYKSGYLILNCDEKIGSGINMQDIKQKINKIYPDFAISPKIIHDKNNTNKNRLELSDLKKVDGDIIDNTQIEAIMKIYMDKNYPSYSEDVRTNILEQLKKIIVDAKSDNVVEYVNSDWKLLFLSFDYMYGYGPDNVIDFTKYPENDIVGIFGENAIGKSAIIDVITFMLFSRSARENVKFVPKDIININANISYGDLIIQSHNIKYLIRKTCYRNRCKSGEHVKPRSELYELTDDPSYHATYKLFNKIYYKKCLTDKNRKNTDDLLTPIIGTYDNFITTSVLLQGNSRTFKSQTNVQKKEFLSQILKIDHFKKAEVVINEKFTKLKAEYDATSLAYKNIMSNKSVDELQQEIDKIIIKLDDLSNQKKQLEKEQLIIKQHIDELIKQILPVANNIKIKSQQDLDQAKNSVNEFKDSKRVKKEAIAKYKLQIAEFEEKLNSLDLLQNTDKITESYNKHAQSVKDNQKKLFDKINELSTKKQSIMLTNIDGNLSIKDITQNIMKLENEILTLDIEIDKLLTDETNIKTKINQLTSIKRETEIIQQNKEYQEKQKNDLSKIFKLINDHTILKQSKQFIQIDPDCTLENLNVELNDASEKLEVINKYLNNSDTIQMLKIKNKLIDDYENLMNSNTDHVYSSLNKLKNGEYIRESFNETIDDIKDTLDLIFKRSNNHVLIKKYEKLQEQLKIYDSQISDKDQLVKNIDDINNDIIKVESNNKTKKEIININDDIKKLMIDQKQLNDQSLNIPSYVKLQDEVKLKDVLQRELDAVIFKHKELLLQKDTINNKIKQGQMNIEIIKNNNILIQQIKEIDTQIIVLRQDLDKVDDKQSEHKIRYEKLRKQQNDKNDYDAEILERVQLGLLVDSENKKIDEKIKVIDYDVQLYEQTKESILRNKKINDDIEKSKEDDKTITNKIQKMTQEIYEYNTTKKNHQKHIIDVEKSISELSKLKSEVEIYTILSKLSGKNGLQLYLLNQYLNLINDRIKLTISGLIDKEIRLELDGETIELKIMIKNDKNDTKENTVQIYTMSGMENLMTDIVFKIIFAQVSVIPKCNLLFIDESISVLDKERMENVEDLFIFLKQYYYNVFLITHIDVVKRHIVNYVEIHKNNGFSLLHNVDNFIDVREEPEKLESIKNNINMEDPTSSDSIESVKSTDIAEDIKVSKKKVKKIK